MFASLRGKVYEIGYWTRLVFYANRHIVLVHKNVLFLHDHSNYSFEKSVIHVAFVKASREINGKLNAFESLIRSSLCIMGFPDHVFMNKL